jgi:hypothetical protein
MGAILCRALSPTGPARKPHNRYADPATAAPDFQAAFSPRSCNRTGSARPTGSAHANEAQLTFDRRLRLKAGHARGRGMAAGCHHNSQPETLFLADSKKFQAISPDRAPNEIALPTKRGPGGRGRLRGTERRRSKWLARGRKHAGKNEQNRVWMKGRPACKRALRLALCALSQGRGPQVAFRNPSLARRGHPPYAEPRP